VEISCNNQKVRFIVSRVEHFDYICSMTYNEKCRDFGKKLAILVSVMIKKKAYLKYSGNSGDSFEFYITVDLEDAKELETLCKKFSSEQGVPVWHNDSGKLLFNFYGIADTGSSLAGIFGVSQLTLDNYKFDENLISSMKTVNKYNI
jgi:hypothetical protein